MRLPEIDLDHVANQVGDWNDLRDSRIFITGGTGFVGSWLVESFLWANSKFNLHAAVTVLSREPHESSDSALTYLQGSIEDFEFPAGKFPFLVHAALDLTPEIGTRRVMEFAASHGTKRVLLTSSGAIYGEQRVSHVPETNPVAPVTDYGRAKQRAELICSEYADKCDIAIARMFAFCGPRLALGRNFAVGNFIQDALEGRDISIRDPGPYRSYLYAADMAAWLWTILLRGKSGCPYNVGSGEALSIGELGAGVAMIFGRKTQISGPASESRYVPSVSGAESTLGLRVVIPLGLALEKMYAWNLNARTIEEAKLTA